MCPKLHLKESTPLAKECFRHTNSCKRPIRKETISRTGGMAESNLWCANHTQMYMCVFAFVMADIPFQSKKLKSFALSLLLFVYIYLPICACLPPVSTFRSSKDSQKKAKKKNHTENFKVTLLRSSTLLCNPVSRTRCFVKCSPNRTGQLMNLHQKRQFFIQQC